MRDEINRQLKEFEDKALLELDMQMTLFKGHIKNFKSKLNRHYKTKDWDPQTSSVFRSKERMIEELMNSKTMVDFEMKIREFISDLHA
mmetsp:Transcript_34304/g.31018  ORF Transcript_34304/g.31018 Transcript_34304/m.31018 type:complete len:88 (+) Transcript_34304:245-508(+)